MGKKDVRTGDGSTTHFGDDGRIIGNSPSERALNPQQGVDTPDWHTPDFDKSDTPKARTAMEAYETYQKLKEHLDEDEAYDRYRKSLPTWEDEENTDKMAEYAMADSQEKILDLLWDLNDQEYGTEETRAEAREMLLVYGGWSKENKRVVLRADEAHTVEVEMDTGQVRSRVHPSGFANSEDMVDTVLHPKDPLAVFARQAASKYGEVPTPETDEPYKPLPTDIESREGTIEHDRIHGIRMSGYASNQLAQLQQKANSSDPDVRNAAEQQLADFANTAEVEDHFVAELDLYPDANEILDINKTTGDVTYQNTAGGQYIHKRLRPNNPLVEYAEFLADPES